MIAKKFVPYLIILPLAIFLIVTLYSSILILIRYSVAIKPSYMQPISYVWSIKNYQDFLFDPGFEAYRMTLLKTLGVALLSTILCLIIGYPFAYFLASPRKPMPAKTLLTLLCLCPYLTGYVIRIYAWRIILGAQGVVNSLLQLTGLTKEPLSALIYGPGAVFIALIYLYVPILAFPIYVSLEKLDVNCIEAAEDLGADSVRTFLRVTLPLTSPGILVGALLAFPVITASYLETVMLGGGSLRLMFGNVIQSLYFVSNDFAMGSAAATILLVVVVVACISLVRLVKVDEVFRVR